MALPAPLIPNVGGLYSGLAQAYALGDEIRKRNLLLQAGQAYAAPSAPVATAAAAQPVAANPLTTNAAEFLKQQEGYAPVAQWDVRQHSGGYGSKAVPGEVFTREKADQYLQRDMAPVSAWIDRNVPNATAGQRTALTSFGYNLGTDDLDRLLPDIRAGNWQSVASRLPTFNKALNERTGRLEPLEGLTARRQREAALLGAAPSGGSAAASNILLQGGMINEGLALQEKARTQQLADQERAEKRQNEMWGYIGDLALAADTPEKWTRAIGSAQRLGLQVDGLEDFANRDAVLARSQRMKTALDMQAEARKAPADYEFTKYGVGNKRSGVLTPYAGGGASEVDLDKAKFAQGLRKEVSDLSKDYRAIQDGKARVEAGSALDSGAGDIAVVYGYMKLLDPGSVVREGEFATAEQTAGVPEQLVSVYNKLISGERLGATHRAQFITAAQRLAGAKQAEQDKIQKRFEGIAREAGIDPGQVILDFRQGEAPDAAEASAPSVGAVEDGYRFKGGNPGDPSSWEPVR